MVTDYLQENTAGANKSPSSIGTPFEFVEIKKKFQEAKDNGTRILVESNELNLSYSVLLELDYIGDRWCMGKVRYHQLNKDENVAYTINYADIYTQDKTYSSSKTTKIIFEGENPYGQGLREGIQANT